MAQRVDCDRIVAGAAIGAGRWSRAAGLREGGADNAKSATHGPDSAPLPTAAVPGLFAARPGGAAGLEFRPSGAAFIDIDEGPPVLRDEVAAADCVCVAG